MRFREFNISEHSYLPATEKKREYNMSGDKDHTQDVHGWKFKGSEEDAKKLRTSISKLAKDYGVNPKAFTANMPQRLTSLEKMNNPSHGAVTHMLSALEIPYFSNMEVKTSNPEENLPHEMAHHNSMHFSQVDDKGGLRIPNKDDDPRTGNVGITGFGYGDSSEERYLDFVNKFRDSRGNMNSQQQKQFKDALYKNVYDRKTNKQRPELKHELANTVSHILSDQNLLNHSSSVENWGKGYRYAPEELWARGFDEFSRLKRLPQNERRSNIITHKTYKQIQKLMNTIKVFKGNTMGKAPSTKNNKTA